MAKAGREQNIGNKRREIKATHEKALYRKVEVNNLLSIIWVWM